MNQRIVRAFDRRLDYQDGLTDEKRLLHTYYALRMALNGAQGGIVEAGCNTGRTSAFIGVVLEELLSANRDFALFDSFGGMPPKSMGDEGTDETVCPEGSLYATPEDVRLSFNQAGCKIEPRIVPGLFNHTLKTPHLPARIAFAYLDGDWYDSIMDSLVAIFPRMNSGGIMLIDDWDFHAIPGCRRACDDFFADKLHKVEACYGQVQGIVYV